MSARNNCTRLFLAKALAARLGITEDTAKRRVSAFISILQEVLAAGKRIELRDFGAFTVCVRKAKIGRNPKNPATGIYAIPARRVVKFRAGKVLDSLLNPEL